MADHAHNANDLAALPRYVAAAKAAALGAASVAAKATRGDYGDAARTVCGHACDACDAATEADKAHKAAATFADDHTPEATEARIHAATDAANRAYAHAADACNAAQRYADAKATDDIPDLLGDADCGAAGGADVPAGMANAAGWFAANGGPPRIADTD